MKKRIMQLTMSLKVINDFLIKDKTMPVDGKICNIIYPDPNGKVTIFYKQEIKPRKPRPKIIIEVDIADVDFETKNRFLNTSIDELGLPPWIYNHIKDDFTNGRSFTETTETQLRKYRSIGNKAIFIIKNMLAQNGFKLNL